MANRDRHRQGLVYGPVRPSGPRDRGRIVGNLLGLLVVVVTVSVLALAIYFFIQARGAAPAPPAPTSTPTASVASIESGPPSTQPSPTTVAVAIDPPTPAPTVPPPTPPATPAPTPAPTLFVPQVMVGPGFITFGTTADAQFRVTDPKTTFGANEPMVWSAHLTEPANSTDLRVRIFKLDSSQPSGQQLVREDTVQPDVNGVQIFFRRLRPIGASEGVGLYTVEYVRGDQVLATGSFLVQ